MTSRIKMLQNLYKESNNKVLINNVIASFSIKGIGLLLGILLLPAYINYFDNQIILGIWFTLISVFSWILTFDLGIGNGLRNNLVDAIVKKNNKEIRSYISSAYFILGGISITSIIIGMIIIEYINWNNVLNLSTELFPSSILLKSVKILFVGIVIQFWLKLIFSVLYAMEKSALPSLLGLISNSLLFCYLFLFKSNAGDQNLLNLSIVYVVSVNIPLIVISIVTFKLWLKKIKISLKYFRWDYAKNITTLGGRFFIIQLALMLILSTNEILITWFYSPESVVHYQIYNKWFYLFVILFSLLTQPVWSAVSKAIVEKRFTWILKVNNFFYILAFIAIIVSVLFGTVFQNLVDLWLGDNYITIDPTTTMYFIFVSALMMLINASTSVANAFNELNCQLVCLIAGVALKIGLTILLSSYISSWSIIVALTAISLLPLAILQPIISKRLINKALMN